MKKKLLLFTIVLISSFFNQVFGQGIYFKGCVNEGLTPGYTLSSDGSVTDDEITRSIFKSALGDYGELITIKWNVSSNQWEILHNAFDPDDEAYNELLYYSSVATYPNPPNLSIGNWANASGSGCDPLNTTNGSQLSGDVADTLPGININPTLTGLPSELTITEDAPPAVPPSEFDISSVVIEDPDIGSGELTLILDADGGRFSLSAGGPLTLSGNGTSRIGIRGTLALVNNYINYPTNMYYTPESNLNGDNASSVDVFINDNGNTGSGGGEDILVGTININISPVNDAPEITVPSTINVFENTNSPLTGISISDVDAGAGDITLGLKVTVGTLSASSGDGVSVTGSGSSELSFSGTLSDINLFFDNLNVAFLNPSGNSDDQILNVIVNDNGNTGSGGSLSDTALTTLIVISEPAEVSSVSAPANETYIEGQDLDFTVNYNKSVVVNTASGTPELILQVGSMIRPASYLSGSGTSNLIFRYTVQTGDQDTDGVGVNTLSLNGGVISNEGVNASLTLQNIDNTDGVLVDAVAPAGYAVTIDQSEINATNQTGVSFTFSAAEVGATYNYNFTSLEGGSTVTGSGTILTPTQQVTGINLSALNEGEVTLNVYLEDANGNVGMPVTAVVLKDLNISPSAMEDNFELDVNTEFSGNVLLNDSDEDGDDIYASLVTGPVNGEVILNVDGSLTYSPRENYVGLDSISYKICDDGIPSLCDTTMVYLEVLDNAIPTGYSVSWADELINESEANAAALKVSAATVGTTLNYTLSSSGDGGSESITGSRPVMNAEEDYLVDVSSLQDGTLSAVIFLTSIYGTPGSEANNNNATLDQTAPNGYSVNIDQNPIDKTNESAISFTLSTSVVGDDFEYTFSSDGGSAEVSGSGIITSVSQGVSGIDLSSLANGDITLSVVMKDPAGNTGDPIAALALKNTNEVPMVADVEINGTPIIGNQLTGSYVYTDLDGDSENGSTYIWYRSGDSSGSGKSEISGAISPQYTLQESDNGKYISFAVTPNDGKEFGTRVESPLVAATKLVQNITFPSIAEKTYGDATFELGNAQTDQGLTVHYSAADPTIVEITGNQAIVIKAGTTIITASQDGDSQVDAAIPVQQTLVVNNATLSISAEDVSKIYGDADPMFTVNYSGFVNGEDKTSLEGSLEITREQGESVGDYAISASGYTSEKYTVNYVDGNLGIQPGLLSISVDPGQQKVYGQEDPQLSYSVTGFSNDDDQSGMVGVLSREPGEDAGLYAITIGTLSAGNNYNLHIEPSEFEILKADQEIIWNQELSIGCDSQSQLTLLAESNSGLPIAYTVTDPAIGEVSGDVFTVLQSGVTTITAQQAGNNNYNPAEAVEHSINISQPGLVRQHWDDVLVFDNTSGNFIGYQWYKNGAAIAGATKQYYSEGQTLNGSYYVVATTENGGQITSCSLEVSGESVANTLMVVPNPVRATSNFEVKASFAQQALDGATISVIDLNGRILQTILAQGEQTMVIAPSQTGIYVILVNLSDGTRKTVNLLVQ